MVLIKVAYSQIRDIKGGGGGRRRGMGAGGPERKLFCVVSLLFNVFLSNLQQCQPITIQFMPPFSYPISYNDKQLNS